MAEKPLYLIYGDDDYLVGSKTKEILDGLVPDEQKSLMLDVIDGSVEVVDDAVNAVNSCLGALRSPGLFCEEKVVWFKNVNFLYDSRVGRSEAVKTSLGHLADLIKQGLPPGQKLVISATKADKRKAFYKACKAAGELHEFSVPDKAYQADKEAGRRLGDILAAAGIRMDKAAKDLFLAKVGNNTRNLVNEVEKLAVYLGDRTDAGVADVRAIVSSSSEAVAWDLTDAFGLRKLPEALEILRQLIFQKENVIGIIIGLENRIRELIVYREALERGWVRSKGGYGVSWSAVEPQFEQLFSAYMSKDPRKIHPFRAGRLVDQARKFSRKRLRYCLREVTRAHAGLVSGSMPQEMTLELLLIKMLAAGTKKKSA